MEKKRARGSSSTAKEEDKILEKLSSIQTRIDDGFTKMENELAVLKREFKQDISAVSKINRKRLGRNQRSQEGERVSQDTNGDHALRIYCTKGRS